MGMTVQVGGSRNTPIYQGPITLGVALGLLAPIAYGLDELDWRGFGRFRVIVSVLRFVGPIALVAGSLASLLFALGVRMALNARRRDLEVAPAGFAVVDRRGRREFEDGQVLAVGVRSRSAPPGTVDLQHGRGSLWVDGRDGPERVDLAWEYPGSEGDPLAPLFGRLLDRLHAQAVRAIDTGGTVAGDGWELSRLGLQAGASADLIPFAEMAQAEFHDGELRIWRRGEAEPCFRVDEGAKNAAILQAIAGERRPATPPGPGEGVASVPGLGRVLFKRRWSIVDRLGLWLICGMLAALGVGITVVMVRQWGASPLAVIPAAVGVLTLLPALVRQVSVFRCHEGGVSRSGLFGVVELPYEDLGQVVAKAQKDSGLLKVTFRPIPGRGRRAVKLLTRPTDEALETLRRYVPAPIEFRG